jgi:TRAP-type C4-dicarboxylate transport system substrate-binding protein
MNLNSWNKLPKDIQKAFEESKTFWESQDDAGRFGNDQIGYDLGKTQGVEYIKLSAADISKVYEAIDTVMRAEAKKIDDKGLPGTAIFQEVRSLAAKYTK